MYDKIKLRKKCFDKCQKYLFSRTDLFKKTKIFYFFFCYKNVNVL